MIAEQVGVFPVDEFVDDVELVVVGVESAFKFSIGALVTKDSAVLDDVGNFVAPRPGVGFIFHVAEGEVGKLIENVAGVVGWFVPRYRPPKVQGWSKTCFNMVFLLNVFSNRTDNGNTPEFAFGLGLGNEFVKVPYEAACLDFDFTFVAPYNFDLTVASIHVCQSEPGFDFDA